MIYILKQEIEQHKDGEIYYSGTGKGYFEDGNLHIIEKGYHFVGKPEDGWHQIGQHDKKEYALGKGARPTVDYADIEIENQAVFNEIMEELKTEEDTDRHHKKTEDSEA